MKLGEILLRKKLISSRQLDEAINLQNSKQTMLGEILLQQGLIVNEQLNIALQEQYWRNNGFWVID